MEFTEEEKPLVLEYFQKYKHSPMSMKMLLCAYFGGARFRQSYISLQLYLEASLSETRSKGKPVEECWYMNNELRNENFFGFPKAKIVNGTLCDVEKMITEWLFIERLTY